MEDYVRNTKCLSYDNHILYVKPQSLKFRLDYCEPSFYENYYQSYFDINHHTFFVISFNIQTKDILLYDIEYKKLVSIYMKNGKSLCDMDHDDEGNIYYINSLKCQSCNRDALFDGFCNLRSCQRNKDIKKNINKLLTLEEFYLTNVGMDFLNNHKCEYCINDFEQNLYWCLDYDGMYDDISEFKVTETIYQYLDRDDTNNDNFGISTYIILHLLNCMLGKEYIKRNTTLKDKVFEKINKNNNLLNYLIGNKKYKKEILKELKLL